MKFLGITPTAHEGYQTAIKTLLSDGEKTAPRGLKTIEIINATWTLNNPEDAKIDFLKTGLPSRQPIYERYAEKEMAWYMSGDLRAGLAPAPFWKTLADSYGNIVSNYGHIVLHDRKYPGHKVGADHIVELLKGDPTTRQAILHYNQPHHYFFGNKDVPCTIVSHFLIRNDKLSMLTFQRSCDIYLGWVYDVLWNCWLLRHIQSRIGCQLGEFTYVIGSLHAYEKDWTNLELICASQP